MSDLKYLFYLKELCHIIDRTLIIIINISIPVDTNPEMGYILNVTSTHPIPTPPHKG